MKKKKNKTKPRAQTYANKEFEPRRYIGAVKPFKVAPKQDLKKGVRNVAQQWRSAKSLREPGRQKRSARAPSELD